MTWIETVIAMAVWLCMAALLAARLAPGLGLQQQHPFESELGRHCPWPSVRRGSGSNSWSSTQSADAELRS